LIRSRGVCDTSMVVNSSKTSPRIDPRPSVLVVGPPAFQSAYPTRTASEGREVADRVESSGAVQRILEGNFAVIVVDADSLDRNLSERLFEAAKTGTEIRILDAAALARSGGPKDEPKPLSDKELVVGDEVGSRVSERLRARLGSIRVGSELLVSKVRNSPGGWGPDVDSLHLEIVDFCESLGFYLDLRVPGGNVPGGWTRFDAMEELRASLETAVARTDCRAHFEGSGSLDTLGIRRDLGRVVKETVWNSIQHGGVKNVWLRIESDGAGDETALSIEDDGRGFGYTGVEEGAFVAHGELETIRSKGIGILICRRILSRYRGAIDFVVKPDGGLRVVVRWNRALKRSDRSAVLAPIVVRVDG
jgi:Histidine kinase-, DNA gyrase B-, and HSP90-like ATPase